PRLEPPRTIPDRGQTIEPSRKNSRERSEPVCPIPMLSENVEAFVAFEQTRFRFRVKVQSCDRCSFGLLFAGYVSSWLSPMSISMRDYLPLSRQGLPRLGKLFLLFAGRIPLRQEQRTKHVVEFIS